MNPMSVLLLLALGRGERREERRFDNGLLLALALSGLTGQALGAPGAPAPTPGAPGAAAAPPALDPSILLLLTMGTDMFGPRSEEAHEDKEIKKLVDALTKGGLSPNVNVNIER